MAGALNRALADALAADPSVLVFGEDVGTLGGVFRVTDGLAKRFGDQRVFDTPLAEAGIVGTAIGMAMGGLRPVVEMQFDAFAYPAFEQITSHLAKLHNRTRGAIDAARRDQDSLRRRHRRRRAPLRLLRGVLHAHAGAAGRHAGHARPTRTACCAQAIDSPDPVMFLEPKRRYWSKTERAAAAGRPGDRPGGRAPRRYRRHRDHLRRPREPPRSRPPRRPRTTAGTSR